MILHQGIFRLIAVGGVFLADGSGRNMYGIYDTLNIWG